MVVKTELCAFSENRIYPGHGIKFIKVWLLLMVIHVVEFIVM